MIDDEENEECKIMVLNSNIAHKIENDNRENTQKSIRNASKYYNINAVKELNGLKKRGGIRHRTKYYTIDDEIVPSDIIRVYLGVSCSTVIDKIFPKNKDEVKKCFGIIRRKWLAKNQSIHKTNVTINGKYADRLEVMRKSNITMSHLRKTIKVSGGKHTVTRMGNTYVFKIAKCSKWMLITKDENNGMARIQKRIRCTEAVE